MGTCKLQSIRPQCGYRLDGISSIRLLDFDDLKSIEIDKGLVTDISDASDLADLEATDVAKYSSSLQNGVYTHTIETFIGELSGELQNGLHLASKKRYVVLFETKAGRMFLYGIEAGATLTFTNQTDGGTGSLVSLSAVSTYPLLEVNTGFLKSYINLPVLVSFGVDGGNQVAELLTSINWQIMAKADWLTVSPMNGQGNKTLNVSAQAHTGRVARSTVVTVQNQNGTRPTKSFTVQQSAAPLFITKIQSSPASLPPSGGVITITGESNAATINVVENNGDRLDGINSSISINGGGAVVGTAGPQETFETAPAGDPGASGKYSFELKLAIPAVDSTEAFSGQLEVNAYVGRGEPLQPEARFLVDFTHEASPSRLSLSKTSIDLAKEGSGQTLSVESNDSWVVS